MTDGRERSLNACLSGFLETVALRMKNIQREIARTGVPMQPITSTPFRDSYRFPVRAHETGQYAYIDVNGNDRFDSGVDPQITAANENSAVALTVATLAQAAAQGPIIEGTIQVRPKTAM